MKYGHPSLLRHPIWVSLQSDKDVKFLLKPLSYGDVYGINEYYYLKDKNPVVSSYIPFDILLNSIQDTRGTVGFSSTADILNALSITDKTFLERTLFEISSLTNTQMENIENLIGIMLAPQLQDESYICSNCEKVPGRQAARNCPLIDLPEQATFRLRINNTSYTACPMANLDTYVINQIIQSNNFLSINSLPLAGGLSEQSVWFVLVSQKYKAKLNELRATMPK